MSEELTDYLKTKFEEIHQNETQTLPNQMILNDEHQNHHEEKQEQKQQQHVEETNEQQNWSTVSEKKVVEQSPPTELPNLIRKSNESGVIKFAKELIDHNNNSTLADDDHDKMMNPIVDSVSSNNIMCDDNNNVIALSFKTDELPANNTSDNISKIINECNGSLIQDVVDDSCKIKNETTSDVEQSFFDSNHKSEMKREILEPELDNSVEINVEKNDYSPPTSQQSQTAINSEVENDEKNKIPIMTETIVINQSNQSNLDENVEKDSIESGVHSDEASDATDIRSSSSQSMGQADDNENTETKQSQHNNKKSFIRSISNNETNFSDAVDGTNLPVSISRSLSTKTVNFKMESIKEEKVVTRKRVSELCDFWQNRGIIDKKPE